LAFLDLEEKIALSGLFFAKYIQNIKHFVKFQNLFDTFWQIFFENLAFIWPLLFIFLDLAILSLSHSPFLSLSVLWGFIVLWLKFVGFDD
jgi:hypothetical protein